jgi:hypothetical protein
LLLYAYRGDVSFVDDGLVTYVRPCVRASVRACVEVNVDIDMRVCESV